MKIRQKVLSSTDRESVIATMREEDQVLSLSSHSPCGMAYCTIEMGIQGTRDLQDFLNNDGEKIKEVEKAHEAAIEDIQLALKAGDMTLATKIANLPLSHWMKGVA